jgi:hypothetical protein
MGDTQEDFLRQNGYDPYDEDDGPPDVYDLPKGLVAEYEALQRQIAPDHSKIRDAVDRLDVAISEAEHMKTRDAFVEILAAIDHIDTLSHDSGPAIEYATEYSREPDDETPEAVMNQKLGEYFPALMRAKGKVPAEMIRHMEDWIREEETAAARRAYEGDLRGAAREDEGEPSALNRMLSRDDYYAHPFHSRPEQYREERRTPEMQQWRRMDAEEAKRKNALSLQELLDAEKREKTTHDLPRRHWDIQHYVETAIPPSQEQYLQRRMGAGAILCGMVRLAAKLDEAGYSSSADRIEAALNLSSGSSRSFQRPFSRPSRA